MLVLSAIAFSVGILAGDGLGFARAPAIALVVVALALVAWARRRGPLGASALVLACALGVAAQADRPRAPEAILDGGKWLADGRVVGQPERAFGSTRVVVDLDAVTRAGQRRGAQARAQVVIHGELVELLRPGDRVRFPAVFRLPRGFRNPGAADAAVRAAARGVALVAGVHEAAALVRLDEKPPPWPLLALERALAAARTAMLRQVIARPPGDDRALLAALTVGDRGEITQALDEAFRVAGVSHVLSVSGLHLAIAAFLFYWGTRRLLVRIPSLARGRPVRRWAALAAIPATVAYAVVTGAEVATVRACVVAVVCFAGIALDRPASALQALAVAALVVLGARPLELYDPSFQLSFAAALGCALLAPRWAPKGRGGRLHLRLARWALRLGAASAAALLATAPIAAWHFAMLAPAGLVTNLVVVPLAELGVVPAGLFGAALAASGLHAIGNALLLVAGFQCDLMARLVCAIARHAPAGRIAAPSLLEVLVFYAGLLALALSVRRAGRIALACALVVSVSFTARLLARRLSTSLTATFLDVGQGDACLLELPHGHTVVVDGGGSFDPGFDPGEQVLAPQLWRRGVSRIDLIVLSHPHPDHANGLGYLAEHFPVGAVWTNAETSEQPGTRRLLRAAAERGVPVERPHAIRLAGTRLQPLRGEGEPDPALGENDNSIVLAVEHGGRRLLLTGDVERQAEAELVAAGELAADAIKVPHHGSRTSSTQPFVDAVHPRIAVISVGAQNRWGFPNPQVLERWQAAGARIFRTDRDGAVAVTLSANGRIDAAPAR